MLKLRKSLTQIEARRKPWFNNKEQELKTTNYMIKLKNIYLLNHNYHIYNSWLYSFLVFIYKSFINSILLFTINEN